MTPPTDDDKTQPHVVKASPPHKVPHVVVIHGPHVGDVYPLRPGQMIIGRSEDADICLLDPSVSRRHARLTTSGDDVMVEDLGSRNGTGIGIRRMADQHLLQDGEVLQVGGVALLKMSYEAAMPAPRRRAADARTIRDIGSRTPSRYYLQDQMKMECAYARRHRTPLALVFIQPTGIAATADKIDSVMGHVATYIHELSRKEDTVVRFAQDRFVVILRETTAGATAMAKRVRAALALRVSLPSAGPMPNVAVTAIVVGLSEGALATPDATFELASVQARYALLGDGSPDVQIVTLVPPASDGQNT